MKHLLTVILRFIVCAGFFGNSTSWASYFSLTQKSEEPQECIAFDARYPYWTNGIYIATYPGYARSREGWTAPYYGGVVTDEKRNKTLLQYASWQMGGKGAPASGIDFAHAGPHMSWKRSNWEGSSGGIKGDWPATDFKRNVWYRFVHRVWTPSSPSPGLGFAGVWMKSLETGEWYHLATFKFPAELTGFDSMGGFNEFFTDSATLKCAVEFRNSYALIGGKWNSEANFSATSHIQDSIKLTASRDKRSVLMETSRNQIDPATKKCAVTPVDRQKIKLVQPAQPDFFDPVGVGSVNAQYGGTRAVVRWRVDPRHSPQLGYEVDILDGAKVIASEKRNDPGARLCLFDLETTPAPGLTARVSITDIFGNVSNPVTVPISQGIPLVPAAAASAATAPGLAYRYFETDKPADWKNLPDFLTLTPVRQGAVDGPDLTPRLRREGYAFEFTGALDVPESAIYGISLTAASGCQVFINDALVIDASDYRSIARYIQAVPLRAGLQSFRLLYVQGPKQSQQPDDFLQIAWSRPGQAEQPIPDTAFRRQPVPSEPQIAITQCDSSGVNLTLATTVEANGHKPVRVEYFGENSRFDYFAMQGARKLDYFLTSTTTPSAATPAVIWGGVDQTIRARLVYDENRTIDSGPLAAKQPPATSGATGGYRLSSLEHHLYPMGVEHTKDQLTLVGESTGFYTQPHKGDVTLIARMIGVTPNEPTPDGTRPMDAANWFSGIILRANLNPTPGEPLGGKKVPFTAIMGSASGATRHCDSTMINGAGNQPSGNIGSDLKWFKLVRRGAEFTTFASPDGADWKQIKSVNLPEMPDDLEVGFVHYSIPSATPIIHRAVFDHIGISP